MKRSFVSTGMFLILFGLILTFLIMPEPATNLHATDSIVQQTCALLTSGGYIVLDSANGGVLQLQNNNFGDSSATSCSYVYASGLYGWNTTKPNPSYDPIYPEQVDTRMQVTPIAGLTTAQLGLSATAQLPPSGTYPWDFSWDVFLDTGSNIRTDEIMIWMEWSNFITPSNQNGWYSFGSALEAPYNLGSFSDGYNTYTLYEYQSSECPTGDNTWACTYHQFRINNQQIPTEVNLLAFIQFLRKLGRDPTSFDSWGVGLGTELWQGSASVQVNSYSLQLGTASSTTTFTEGQSALSTSTTARATSNATTMSTSTQTTTSSATSSTSSSTSSLVTTSSSTQTTTLSTTTSSTASLTSTSQTTTTPLRHASISLNPSSGSAGLTVDVSGSGFSSSDSACSLSGSVVASSTCSVSNGSLTGSFTVANVASGSYSVTVSRTQAGDSASASFIVPPPSLTLSSTSAYIGATVGATGAYFSKADTGCSLSGNPVRALTCSISNGTLSATFNVTSISAGTYTITATGAPGGDSAFATFAVKPASLTFNPTSALGGSNVTVLGVGFFLNDTSCILSGTSVVSQSCTLSRGALTGSFIVANATANGAPVPYTLTATGNPAGDSASATFIVTSPARMITLNPSSARVGSTVQVDASGFSADDSSCSISGGGVTSETCSISDGLITGSFTIANVIAGGYTVTVTGSPVGDSVTADFTVTSLSIVLTPDSGLPGTTVQVSGSGFVSGDSSCTLSGSAVSSPSCSISSGTLSGSFIVTNVTAASYVVTAIGSPSIDVVSATFSVTAPLATETTTSSTSPMLYSPDFSLASTSNVIVTQGDSGSATVTVRSVYGFDGPVTLSASWVGTAPDGVNLLIASPITLMPNGTGIAALTVFASPTASAGTFTVQVQGTSGSMSHILSPNISVQILQAVSTESSTSVSSMTSTTRSTSSVSVSMTTSAPTLPTNCPVSTATSGSALAPLAQGLRVFRDQSIMKTRTGAAFMTVFNAWYYSFSPPLASYLGAHPTQRAVFGYALYPLIGLLYTSYYAYMLISPLNNEIAALTAGLLVAGMIGLIYLTPFLYLVNRAFRKISITSRLDAKVLLCSSVASCVAIAFSYSAGLELVLGLAAAGLLLSSLTLGVMGGIRALNCIKLTYPHRQLAILNDVAKTATHHPMKYHGFTLTHEKS